MDQPLFLTPAAWAQANFGAVDLGLEPGDLRFEIIYLGLEVVEFCLKFGHRADRGTWGAIRGAS